MLMIKLAVYEFGCRHFIFEGTVMQIIWWQICDHSTQTTNTEFFSFIAVLVFKLMSRKVLFKKRKDNRNC